ncbi:hypothetical protein T02_13333 [Trichinella nativa]|uniref:Uncharacterized protein n=1 Tax=Trichinella nativa TaxID=6335 RepID=A0A0V1LLW9_9BILA|nr:hypothetical protein T02_13333 [Trichinella nativa]
MRAIRATIDEKALLQLLSKSFLPAKRGSTIANENTSNVLRMQILKRTTGEKVVTRPQGSRPREQVIFSSFVHFQLVIGRNGDRKGPDKVQPSATGQLTVSGDQVAGNGQTIGKPPLNVGYF